MVMKMVWQQDNCEADFCQNPVPNGHESDLSSSRKKVRIRTEVLTPRSVLLSPLSFFEHNTSPSLGPGLDDDYGPSLDHKYISRVKVLKGVSESLLSLASARLRLCYYEGLYSY